MSETNTRKNKSRVISKDELKKLIKNTHGRDRLIIVALGLGGMREGELSHMRKSWLHISDKKSVEKKINHVEIPNKPQLCDCVDCQLQAYFEKKRNEVKKDVDWYPKLQKKFYRLRKQDKLKNLKCYWNPTSKSGIRIISLSTLRMKKTFRKWFEVNDSIGMTRQGIWLRVKTLGKKILEKKISPAILRASFAKILADSGASTKALKENMGWAKIDSAHVYIKSKNK